MAARPRLLLVDPGGGDPAERTKAAALVAEGWDVTVLGPERIREGTRVVDAAPADPAAPYRLVLGRLVGKPPNRCVFATGMAEAFATPPDVVHVLADEGFALALQALGEARVRSPGALRVAHSWQNILTSWKRHGQPLKALYAFDCGVEQVVFRLSHGLVARNEEAIGVLRARGYRKPIAHIPWGVDLEAVREGVKADRHPPERVARPLYGYVGRLVPEKGVDTLLRALATAPGSLLLVGDGPERAGLERLARALGISDRVRFLGSVARAEVPAWLAQMDALVLPSRETAGWKEQFGRVLVEAMAVGTPCVGSDSGAIPSVIGEAGAVFRTDDSVSLAAALREVAARRDELSEKARKRAEQFTWARFARETTRFFEELRRTR